MIEATLGKTVTITIEVHDLATDVLKDPDVLTITWLRPDKTQSDPLVPARTSEGLYKHSYSPPRQAGMTGKHKYVVETSNPNDTYEGEVYFAPSPFLS